MFFNLQVANAVEVILAAPKKVPEGTKERLSRDLCLYSQTSKFKIFIGAGLLEEGGLWKDTQVFANHQAGQV